ncbi:MAG: hypothetical protein ACE5HS_09750 [bacterium]
MKWVRRKVGVRVNFLRLDIATPAAKEVMEKYHIPLNSAYVLFDQHGQEVWRSFAIPLNGRKALRKINTLLEV